MSQMLQDRIRATITRHLGSPDTDVDKVVAWRRGDLDVVLQKDSPADGAYVWVPCLADVVDVPLPATLYMPGKSRHSGVERRGSLALDRTALRFCLKEAEQVGVLERWLLATAAALAMPRAVR